MSGVLQPSDAGRAGEMNMLELAARVEAAEAGDQCDLLREAWLALHPGAFADLSGYPQGITESNSDAHARRFFRKLLSAGAYLDAAMTLVPETVNGRNTFPLINKQAANDWRAHIGIPGPKEQGVNGKGAAPALALCAAALRALSNQGDQ